MTAREMFEKLGWDNVKYILNELQKHISDDTDKKLLIFDNKEKLNSFKRKYHNDFEYMGGFILITIGELTYEYKLIGMRFKNYEFI